MDACCSQKNDYIFRYFAKNTHTNHHCIDKEKFMSGKIFYRERTKVKEGAKAPRFRIVGVTGADLKVYANHLRRQEIEQIAAETQCDLVQLKTKPKKKK